ncbi:LysR family transcriptional regulator [[Clostridium] aminophilum]|uniref:LysR family transcriptional regulator n=1 Tax=[Clostridium] aminophilum TaxID=1526 RepID=UPI0026EAD6FD|nr:LysR family transcriptional regulator [[Clostridium] aminophilum]MDD6196969.1 LysR family transcriptional regulator [[Clostridium] aminophilum]
MDEKDFEMLDALDKTKNITRTAEMLYVTQSALSKRLASIENELNARIVVRSRQGIHFTAEGEIILKHARRAQAVLQDMRNTLDAQRGYVCGSLRAGVSINYSAYRLGKILADLHMEYPHVNAQVSTDTSVSIYRKLCIGEYDIAIIRGEFPWDGFSQKLATERVCMIVNSKDADVPLQDLPFISRRTEQAYENQVSRWFREHDLRPDTGNISLGSIGACVQMVEQGVGWSIVPEIGLSKFSGKVTPLSFADGTEFTRSTYLLCHTDIAELPQMRAFIDIARNNAGR